MKKILLFYILLQYAGFLYAQLQQPMFQTAIYFEDAVGHKDTIVVGYDTIANGYYNPQFGDLDINATFDSVFEVRATYFSSFWKIFGGKTVDSLILSKKITVPAQEYVNAHGCYASRKILFFIRALHQPITMRWSSSDFIQNCIDNTFFTPDFIYELINPIYWMEEPWIRYCCATKFDSCSISLGPDATPEYEYPYIITYPVEGSGNAADSIYGITLYMIAGDYYSPCKLVGSGEPQLVYESTLILLPNPVSDLLRVEQAGDGTPLGDIFIVDQAGRQIYFHPGVTEPVFTLPVADWKPGVYFLVTRVQGGKRNIVKWVKH